jgi:hypothetical protein
VAVEKRFPPWMPNEILNEFLPPLQHPQPRGREVQFRLGAVLQRSRTPSLRVAGFEDDDENEAKRFVSTTQNHAN